MDFSATFIIKNTVSLCCFCVLLCFATTSKPVVASENCEFPAIFNFGDSNSDTGGFPAAFFQPPYPYGETFFHKPSGRYTDGRVMIDFIANSLGLPFLSAYLDSVGTNFSQGVNFATAAATVTLPSFIYPGGGFSPFYLDIQLDQFSQFKNRSQVARKRGGVYVELLPEEEYFEKGLYTIDIGHNDLAEGLYSNLTVEQVNATVPDIIGNLSAHVKGLYDLGGRTFWIHNTDPMGCLPYMLVSFPDVAISQYFNSKLKEAVLQLRKDLPSAAITYVDVYSVKYELLSHPEKYGFEHSLVACCGYGGKYNYNNEVLCGGTITVNGTDIFIGACDRPWVRANWDGIHYTEAANKFVFDRISSGAYTDPPVPLKMACHRKDSR
ncbi:hypothetical protein PVL29_023277 [Vitis rotundifolia]|uniref:Uncharacterized protein n=1 Tax=Vitis rotundifolia TaxID=103349 RepID=A0AA39D903_VITRO|nr:hypothetical protein PVL29_023277 [Vitis rotundifolia]